MSLQSAQQAVVCRAAADLLFGACIKGVYTTEGVAHLASRICLGLL